MDFIKFFGIISSFQGIVRGKVDIRYDQCGFAIKQLQNSVWGGTGLNKQHL